MSCFHELQSTLSDLRMKKPLVLSLTNTVTMDFMANGLLALGAVPLMSDAVEEIDELLAVSQALNINIGTLTPAFQQRALRAARLAQMKKIPLVLDPVGAGASRLRTSAARELLPFADIIRGNASEILALTGNASGGRGVENNSSFEAAMDAANTLTQSGKVVLVSGKTDYIGYQQQSQKLFFGAPMMALVTGMGCTLTAVIAAFAGTGLSHYQATRYATMYFGLCGQAAAITAKAPGVFRQVFIDTLYAPDWPLFQQFLASEAI